MKTLETRGTKIDAEQSRLHPGATLPVVHSTSQRLEVILAVVLAAAIALIFWSQQRYPALEKKLHAGTGVQVKGAISFDALLRVPPTEPFAERVAKTGVNWLYTNRFGMYFALPFGAALMTMMTFVTRPKRFKGAANNVLIGVIAGAPLGVCTNCATPIGQSMLAGGASSRMTVAAMISSPCFNPVVIAMVLALFPPQLILLRLLVPGLLLLLLPLLVEENPVRSPGIKIPEVPLPLGERLQTFASIYLRNLVRVTWMTLPWMLLAALLGAIAAELVPAYGTHLHASFFGVILVSLFGTVLPVPMALDVALAFVLMKAGAPLPYVAALLCTLGPISIYSLTALGKQLSRTAALRLAGATAGLGVLAGTIMLAFSLS